MKNWLFLFVLVLIVCSCGDNNVNANDGYDYTGVWELTELRMLIPQDFNDDGQTSYNVKDELDCLFDVITIHSNNTYEIYGMGISIQHVSNILIDISCTEILESNGTCEAEETGIRIDAHSWIRTGNEIKFVTDDAEFPEFSKVVYTKQ